jgi:hypothetical protein
VSGGRAITADKPEIRRIGVGQKQQQAEYFQRARHDGKYASGWLIFEN